MQKLTTPLLQTLQNRRRTSRVVAANNGKVLVRSALSSTDSFWAKYSDLYTIVLSASWLQLLAGFTVINVFMWTFFGTVFYAMRHHKQADGVTSCVDNMNSYAEAIFFAVETIQTIGYGNIAPGSQGGCVPEIVTVCIMVMCALLVHTLVVGTIVYKAYMPQNRALTVKFSETMIHTRRDGVDYLAFRVADIRKKNLCAMHVTGVVYMEVSTNEGQALDLEARNLEIIPQYNSTPLLLPQVFLHPLRSGSPLAFLTQENAVWSDLEIVILLEGMSQVTGLNTQARQSYLVRNIQWNRNFVRMVSRAGDESPEARQRWQVDFSKISETVPVTNVRIVRPRGSSGALISNVRLAAGEEQYPARQHVGNNNRLWNIPFPQYAPPFVVSGFADPEAVAASLGQIPKWSLCGRVKVVDGLPVNPEGRTGVAGVGKMKRWGPHVSIVLLLLRKQTDQTQVLYVSSRSGARFTKSSLPESSVNLPQTTNSQSEVLRFVCDWAATRTGELLRGVCLSGDCYEKLPAPTVASSGYVDDTRNTDNAWLEMAVVRVVVDCGCSNNNTGTEGAPVTPADAEGEWVDVRDQQRFAMINSSVHKAIIGAISHPGSAFAIESSPR